MTSFVGRKRELKRLVELGQKRVASFVVVKGRRRIGKSRLIKELGGGFDHFYSFVGLAPTGQVTAKQQLDEFCRQISRQFNIPLARYDDWGDAFWAVGERVRSGKVLICFDEISWMGSKDPTFLPKIKNFWDLQLKQNDKLVFIVCGSASAWIEKNLLGSTGFVGRISLTLTLEELPLYDCDRFWPKNISAYEKFKILAVTGGVPKYLEEINPKFSAEENLRRLCFSKGGFLVEEFEQIFSDIFLRQSELYKKIIRALSQGSKSVAEICASLNMRRHGRIPEYLWELELAGFITKDHTWRLQTGKDMRVYQYRLSDNYLRFYVKYIEPNMSKINRNAFALKSLTSLPEWHSIMGFQFENLLVSNRHALYRILDIPLSEIVRANPYFQRKTARAPGCQIDYAIQTKFNNLYICEIKFSKHPIGVDVVESVQAKIDAMKLPRGFSCRPVLIHVNGVTDDVVDRDFFANIIDISTLLDHPPG